MIQIYSPTNTNFDQNGSVLTPISCELSIEINGVWSVQLESVLNDEIVENAVLKVPTPYGDQLYRIYSVTKTPTRVNAIAVPIFQDAQNEVFIYDTRPTNKNGQQALNDICTTKYKGHSDITKQATAYYQMKNLINCLAGDDENSFINRWGGEIRYDNYDVYINERLGQDNGVRVEFGLNIKSIQEDIDMSSVATKIIPVAYNGRTLPQGQTVNSPLINNYPTPYIKVIEYQDIRLKEDVSGDQEGVTVCDTLEELYTALTERAEQEFENGIDLPTITYNVDIVDLSRMDEYKNYKPLVTINLGDTVHIYHKRLNINTEARVIALTYDCINQKNSSLTIGDYQPSFFDNASDTSSVVDKVVDKGNGTLLGDKISGVINLMNTALKAQKNVAERQDVRAILFEDLDEDSSTFGALCIGTQGIQISKERNATNTDWVWGTAIDFQTINANLIVAGILTDRNGKFFFNLNTGEFSASDGTFSGTITGSTITGTSIEGSTFQTKLTDYEQVKIHDKIIEFYGSINPTLRATLGLDSSNLQLENIFNYGYSLLGKNDDGSLDTFVGFSNKVGHDIDGNEVPKNIVVYKPINMNFISMLYGLSTAYPSWNKASKFWLPITSISNVADASVASIVKVQGQNFLEVTVYNGGNYAPDKYRIPITKV